MSERHLGPSPCIDSSATVRNSRLGAWTEIGPRSLFLDSTLQDYSYVMNDTQIDFSRIGKFCSLASHVRLNPGNHPMWRASQHHFTYRSEQYGLGSDDTDFFDWRRKHNVQIGHDVWIGHGAVILPGVNVGTGAVIGAGAVVTQDIPIYTIVAGVPARHIRHRFTIPIQNALLRIRWWDWSRDQLRAALPDFRCLSIEDFITKYDPGVSQEIMS